MLRKGIAKLWTWAALQREMGATGRGSTEWESSPERGSDPAQEASPHGAAEPAAKPR